MSFSKFFTTLSILLAAFGAGMVQPASAHIVGITVPHDSTPYPGQRFNVTFHTARNTKNDTDYYAIFGITADHHLPRHEIGQIIGEGYDLVAHKHRNTSHGTFKVSLTVPKNLKSIDIKTYRLTTAVTSTTGTKGEVKLKYWSTNVTVGRTLPLDILGRD